jgi:tetratricopeptide (TPR) repeat protein
MALAVLGEDLDAMIALADRALALNPSCARGWHISGFLRLWAGQTDLAIEHGKMALRLSPRAGGRGSAFLIGTALFFSGRFEEAVPRLWVAIEAHPAFPNPYRYLAACYAHMGRLDEARGDNRAAARDHPRADGGSPASVPKSAAPRAVLVRPTAGAGRDLMTTAPVSALYHSQVRLYK